jgi:predicted dehydrogenase
MAKRTPKTTRRQFLQDTAAASLGALGLPLIVPAAALGQGDKAAASERITLGCIGTGGRGRSLLNLFLREKDVQVVAVCDVDSSHRNQALELVNKQSASQDCAAYKDFRELLEHKDLNAVVVATPDHWHALAAVAAVRAGKDVYCEKPLANSVAEGRAICEAVRQTHRILQTGSHERSGNNARFACELVRNGRIGKLHTIRINLPCADRHHLQAREVTAVPPEMPVPEGFDYDAWLGHTAKVPYTEKRCHFWWRFVLAYGGGEMTDRGAHVIDLAQLGAGFDDTGPVEVEARGVRNPASLYDVFWDYLFVNTYANGVTLIGSASGPRGVKFIGTDGWVFLHVHGAKLEAEPAALLQEKREAFAVQLPRSPDGTSPIRGHVRGFLDAVKSRQQPLAPAEVGHRTATVCHLNNIALLLGRKLRWDPKTEQFLDDAEANRLLAPKMREPWRL